MLYGMFVLSLVFVLYRTFYIENIYIENSFLYEKILIVLNVILNIYGNG